MWSAVLATVAITYGGCSSAPPSRPLAPPNASPDAARGTGAGSASRSIGDGDDDDGDDGAPGASPPAGAPAPGATGVGGNQRFRHFDDAKKALSRIYAEGAQHTDLYCGCTFVAEPGRGLRVDLASCSYVAARDRARAERIEWEHAVPAAAFGRTFAAWREGDPRCVDSRGKRYRGRRCARATSAEFSRIEADLHNLFPVVGEVNGLRGDLPMGLLDEPGRGSHRGSTASFSFGGCTSAIDKGVFLPRPEVRGDLARAYKYMDRSYPERQIVDDAHRTVFDRWDREDPPDAWERERNRRIEAAQGNRNTFIEEPGK